MTDEPYADDLDDEVLDNEVSYPIADMGHGEYRATLRVSKDVADGEVLKQTLAAFARSISPHTTVEVVFGSTTPPPLLVTLDDVAYSLGITKVYARELVKQGWLQPIHFRGSDDPKVRYARAEEALKGGRWSGWEVRFLWSDLVEFAQWCKDHQHVPTYAAPMPEKTVIRNDWPHGGQVKSTAAVTRKVLREAVTEDGKQEWVAVHEIVRRVQEAMPYKQVAYKSVADALRQAVHRGTARKRTYKATFRNGQGAAYRWMPARERMLETFEQRHETPPQDDEEETA